MLLRTTAFKYLNEALMELEATKLVVHITVSSLSKAVMYDRMITWNL